MLARPPRLGAPAPPWYRARPARWARWARLAALAPVLVLAAACSGDDDDDDDPTGPGGGINGAYALTQLNGQAVPADRVEGILALDDGDYELAVAVDGQTLLEDAGSYEHSGSQIDFTSSGGNGEYSGTLSGNNRVITIADGEDSLRFERR